MLCVGRSLLKPQWRFSPPAAILRWPHREVWRVCVCVCIYLCVYIILCICVLVHLCVCVCVRVFYWKYHIERNLTSVSAYLCLFGFPRWSGFLHQILSSGKQRKTLSVQVIASGHWEGTQSGGPLLPGIIRRAMEAVIDIHTYIHTYCTYIHTHTHTYTLYVHMYVCMYLTLMYANAVRTYVHTYKQTKTF